jgi:hypothetical protein
MRDFSPGQAAYGTGLRDATISAAGDPAGSGTFTPLSINLPTAGNALRGIGQKFATNPVTGRGTMTAPIAISPGQSGFGPELSISYGSGAGNSPVGFGWTCPPCPLRVKLTGVCRSITTLASSRSLFSSERKTSFLCSTGTARAGARHAASRVLPTVSIATAPASKGYSPESNVRRYLPSLKTFTGGPSPATTCSASTAKTPALALTILKIPAAFLVGSSVTVAPTRATQSSTNTKLETVPASI